MLYFYKLGNAWVLGTSVLAFIPSGTYFMRKQDAEKIDLLPLNRNSNLKAILGITVTEIAKNASGDKYADEAEFISAVAEFFVESTKGNAFAFTDFTEEELAAIKGIQGDPGLFDAPLIYCVDYAALQTALIAAGLMAAE